MQSYLEAEKSNHKLEFMNLRKEYELQQKTINELTEKVKLEQ
jgi:hypothetical protein